MLKTFVRYTALLSLLVASTSGFAQAETTTEDIRTNLTRVMIEKARQVGRDNPTGTATDGYDAIKAMVWPGEPKSPAEKDLDELRKRAITNFIQGFADLERNPNMKNKEIKYDISMGSKEKGLGDAVIVRFIYPPEFMPPNSAYKGLEWRLRWRKSSSAAGIELWLLETVINFPLSNNPGQMAGESFTLQ